MKFSLSILPLMVLVSFLPGVGCSSPPELWVENSYEEVRYDDAFDLTKDFLDRDYKIVKASLSEGRIETAWDQPIVGYKRNTTRSKAIAQLSRTPEQAISIKVRIARQVTDTPSPLIQIAEDEWEEYPDDLEEAKELSQRIYAVLGDFGISDKMREALEEGVDIDDVLGIEREDK